MSVATYLVELIQQHAKIIQLGVALFVVSGLIYFPNLKSTYIAINSYLLLKWLTNYRKCTVSYMEVAGRSMLAGEKVKKEQGVIYTFLEQVYDMRNESYIYILMAIQVFYLLSFYNFLG